MYFIHIYLLCSPPQPIPDPSLIPKLPPTHWNMVYLPEATTLRKKISK